MWGLLQIQSSNSIITIKNSLQLPERCGAILLPSATLFPQGVQPLHIFEPRYREMLDDALQSHCMICMGTLTSEETDNPQECTAPVGTVGLIRASREQTDGRSNLILHGVLRVEFTEWLFEKDYPFAAIQPAPSVSVPESETQAVVDDLRSAVYLALQNFPDAIAEQVKNAVEQVAQSPAAFADVIAQQFILDPAMRRELLEEPSVKKRFDKLVHELRNAERDDRN